MFAFICAVLARIARNASRDLRRTIITSSATNGAAAWVFTPDKHWPRTGDVVDGLLYLGGNHKVHPSPTIYLDPEYQRELRRRATIIKAYSGQDFLPMIDDLVRQGEQLRDTKRLH